MDQDLTIERDGASGLYPWRPRQVGKVCLEEELFHRAVLTHPLHISDLVLSPTMTESALDTSVVIPCHTERRWTELCRAIRSALAQSAPPHTVIVAVDGNVALYERLLSWSTDIQVILNTTRPGASTTRNAGASMAETPIIAFLDDDASARPEWLTNLLAPFHEPEVVGTGGFVAPRWRVPRPEWFPDEFAWVVGASFSGLPTTRSTVRNVWSENMAVRRSVFDQVGGFRVAFTKVGNVSRPDDTDLCVRMGKAAPDAKWVYVPDAVVDHDVGAERARFSFFLRRCFAEGRGKVEMARWNGSTSTLVDEANYLRHTLPRGFARHARRGVSTRNLGEVSRAAAIVAGVAAAGCGAAVATAHRDRS
jgi:GT2 family glycosyltransferase